MKEPSNQTIYALLQEIQKQNNIDHKLIAARQDKTNGGVTANTLWRARMTGAVTIISLIFTGVLIPIVLKLFF